LIPAWRIVKARHAATALSGDGGLHAGGCWHRQGVRVVYCASTLSLAALELLVHLGRSHVGIRFVVFRIDIPDGARVEELHRGELPRNWRSEPPIEATRRLGMEWLRACESAVLRVPSAVIPAEYNYLLNPLHGDFKRLRRGRGEPFAFDPRLWVAR